MWITSACEGSFGSCLSCGVFPSGARVRAREKVSRAARRKSCGVGREASERGLESSGIEQVGTRDCAVAGLV